MVEEPETDEEEIPIDFSKIKNFFGKKKKKLADTKDNVQKSEEAQQPKSDEKKETTEEQKKPEKETKQEAKSEDIKSDKKEEAEDEEISIDFSKIKSFFKKKKREETEKEKKADDEDDEISFNFSKIKSFFKKKKETQASKEDEEEEISFDIKKAISFFNNKKMLLIPIIILILAMSLSIHLRVQSAHLPVTDGWAAQQIETINRQIISQGINQQYPNLPDSNRNSLINREYKKLMDEGMVMMPTPQGIQKIPHKDAIKEISKQYKSRFQDDSGQTYLLAIDPYFWMRFAKNIVDHGYPGDELRNPKTEELCTTPSKDCISWDNHMFAPLGRTTLPDIFHPYLEAWLFKIARIFNSNLSLMSLVFYVPVLLSALAVIPAFFIGRRLSGNFSGFIAAVIIAIHPTFLTRTAGGFADTDAYNVLFPLLIAWAFLEALNVKSTKNKFILSSIAGLLTGFYSLAWGGWWFIFDFIIASYFIYLIYYIILHRDELKKGVVKFLNSPVLKRYLVVGIIFILSSGAFVSLFTSFDNFKGVANYAFGFTKIKEVGTQKVWPNVFTTVAEQNEASIGTIINNIGGRSSLFIALLGLLLITKKDYKSKDWLFIVASAIWYIIALSLKSEDIITTTIMFGLPIAIILLIALKNKDFDIDISMSILLIIWFLATIYASTKGVRWVLLMVPAFALAFGATLGIIYRYVSNILTKELNINKLLSRISVILLLSLLLLGPWNSAKSVANNEIPSMNDAWYRSLDKINKEAAPDAIINSWWDFGHWFKAIGDRAVTFDGTSQNQPQAHWIGNVLLTNNEEEAIGILRMLDCGATKAFNNLDKVIQDTAGSVDITYEIIVLDKEKAKEVLLKNDLNPEQAEEVLKYSHCDPPENYFITSHDMIGKSGVWAHFGGWNFNKAQIYYTLNKKEYKNNKQESLKYLMNRFNYSEEEADNLYYTVRSLKGGRDVNDWISPWPGYMQSSFVGCSKSTNTTVLCSLPQGGKVLINKTNMDASIPTQQGIKHPNSLVYLTNDSIIEKKFNDSIGLSIVLMPSGDENFVSISTSPELSASMFTRLFYLEGHGLKHFKRFSDERDLFNNRIIVWKVDWEGNETNILGHFKEKETQETKIEEQAINETVTGNESNNKTSDKENIINNSKDES